MTIWLCTTSTWGYTTVQKRSRIHVSRIENASTCAAYISNWEDVKCNRIRASSWRTVNSLHPVVSCKTTLKINLSMCT